MSLVLRRPDIRLLPQPQALPEGRPAAVLVTLWPPPAGKGMPETASGGQWRLLLIRRSDGMGTHAGQLAFPGGAREPEDPDMAACALREAREEIALDPAALEVVGYLPAVAIPVSGFAVQPVVASVAPSLSAAALRPEPTEVQGLFWHTLDELEATAGWERRPPQSQRTGVWPMFALPEGRLWGATAVMVKSLLRRWHPGSDRPGTA